MNTPSSSDVRAVNGKLDVDQIAVNPIFHFDLTPVLEHCDSAIGRNHDWLQLMCERHIAKIAPKEIVLFKDNGFFLVVQSCSGGASLAVANTVNVALLKHFFGTESLRPELGTLFRVATRCELGEDVPPEIFQKIASPEQVSEPAVRNGASVGDTAKDTDLFFRLDASGITGCSGLRTAFVPVYDLRRNTPTTFFCAPVSADISGSVIGAKALKNIDPRDRPWLDEALLKQAIDLTRQIAKADFVAAIGVSVSYETLSWSRGRHLYQSALRGADAMANPFLLIKIEDIPVGTPLTRIAEVVGAIRPFVRRIFLHLPESEMRSLESGNIGMSGVVGTLPDDVTPRTSVKIATSLMRVANAQRAFPCMHGVNSEQSLGLVRAAGIRFASGRALGLDLLCDGRPLKMIGSLARGCAQAA